MPTPTPSTEATVTVKQEEDDSVASTSLLQVPTLSMVNDPSREPTVPRTLHRPDFVVRL